MQSVKIIHIQQSTLIRGIRIGPHIPNKYGTLEDLSSNLRPQNEGIMNKQRVRLHLVHLWISIQRKSLFCPSIQWPVD